MPNTEAIDGTHQQSADFPRHTVTRDLGGKRTANFFAKCDKSIPWDQLAEPLKDMYANHTSKGGASHWPVVMMIKCLMLQKWFNLSDPMLEEMLLDRLSFRRFVGLSIADKTPDETTFVVFRRRLRQHGHADTLFQKTVEILKQRGVILEKGTCVDATIIETSRGCKRENDSIPGIKPPAIPKRTAEPITASRPTSPPTLMALSRTIASIPPRRTTHSTSMI